MLEWEMEIVNKLNAANVAKDTLASILPKNFKIDIIRTGLGQKPVSLEVIGSFSLEEVFINLQDTNERIEYVVDGKSYMVRMNSHRYSTFQHSNICVACGLVGTKFLLEKYPNDQHPHFNLYGIEDGGLVLFTKDHIQAKSHGGPDCISNFQTMCCICNNLKRSDHLPLSGVRELRRVFNENRNLPKKLLNSLLNDARKNLIVPRPATNKKIDNSIITLKVDLNIVHKAGFPNHLQAWPVRNKYNIPDMIHIASMKRGWVLKPEAIEGGKIVVRFDQNRVVVISQKMTDLKYSQPESK